MTKRDFKAQLPRRRFLQSAAALGSSVAVPMLATTPAYAQKTTKKIIYATWGGSWETAWRAAWADPFLKQTGIEVKAVTGNTMGRLQAMVEAGRPEWDLLEGTPDLGTIGAKKGLLEKLDFDVIDRSKILGRPEFFTDYTVPQVLFGYVMVYNTRFEEAPTDWTSFWDLKRFPGKRAFNNRIQAAGVLESALLADGVKAADLYPLDVPRAFKKLDEIRDEIIWYDSLPQSEQLMRSGQATLGLLANGRASTTKSSGGPVELVPELSFLTWSVFGIPKGAPNKAETMEFLNFVLQPKQQAAIAMGYSYGPVVMQAWDEIPESRWPSLLTVPSVVEKGLFTDPVWWSANLESVNEQFQSWKLG